ncbi:MAG: methyltransferase [Rikenellaceae bacterium]
MKVGTDGVLIGAWSAVENTDRHLLDIGSGTGLIALMLAQRSDAVVDAVEICSDSAAQAAENIAISPWSQRINIHNVNIADFNQSYSYDLIVSNPPFFSNSLLPPDESRTTARHTTSLTFEMLIASVERLLSSSGRFALILPANESEEFESSSKGRLYLWRKCLVKSRVGSDCKRVMCEYRLAQADDIQQTELAIREAQSNEYTAEYRNLTADFYLKF